MVQEGPAPQVVEGEAWNPPIHDSFTPTDILLSDMTLSVIKSTINSSTAFSIALSSFNIQARGQLDRV